MSPYEEYCQKKAQYNRDVRDIIMSGQITSADKINDDSKERLLKLTIVLYYYTVGNE